MRHKTIAATIFVLFIAGSAVAAESPAVTEQPDPDPGRFAAAIATFVSWDSKNAVPDGPILFVGSSSIRLWTTAMAFPDWPVINRGFGGAELSDVVHYYDRVIRPYAPSQIFLYAGDNDIAAGKAPRQVFEDYREIARMVAGDFPDTELVFISIKPSKARWSMWPAMAETNCMVRGYAGEHDNLGFADLASPLLDDAGEPKNVYVEDGLHLNERGYALWQQALAPLLAPAGGG